MPHLPSILRRAVFSALVLLCCGTAGSAYAAPMLGWSTPHAFDSAGAPTAVSCASETACVAVDAGGNAFEATSPGAGAPSWTGAAIDAAGAPLQAVSCAPAGPCVAVDGHGQALAEATPGSSSWSTNDIDGTSSLTGVSCPTSSLCVAVDSAGRVLWSTAPRTASWSAALVDAGHVLRGVSCASVSLCVAVDADGRVLSSSDPAGGAGAWHVQSVDFAGLRAVSCAGSECVAVDEAGQVLASANPGAAGATWSITPVALEGLLAVSCAPSGLCAASGTAGSAFASDDAVTSAPGWAGSSSGAGDLTGVSCLSGGLCVAVDAAGRSVSARPPAPTASTSAAAGVEATSATLAGVVDPRDAALRSCRFEYGVSAAYAESISCSTSPAATGGPQPVTATPSDLEPNTIYHFRFIAASASGEAAGADATFTTATSPAVAVIHPHPSISGTPAPGQTLTCRPGIESGARTTLAYAWLRETVPVAGSTQSTYAVKGRDSGHHLQCQVTATDGGGSATGSSGFVTVPAGGVPEAAGETLVGTAAYAKGKVTLPVACSAHASSGCAISARLTVSGAGGSRSAASTLAFASARVPAGVRRTIALALTKKARRLLAKRKRLPTQLAVSGTVIGVIRAQLAQESLAIVAGQRATATKVALGRSARAWSARSAAGAAAAAKVLAATPYMGWDTYFALGGRISESNVLEEASRMLTLGLRKRGYRYVWLDVGWWHGARDANGQIEVSRVQWPHGLAWLAATLHSAGFLVGLYTDAGPNGCGGAGQGSYGHYQQDADTFAAWGFDAVKVDYCGGSEYRLEPAAAYASFSRALRGNASRRPILLNICNFVLPGSTEGQGASVAESAFASYSFGPSVGNSWRTDTDVGSPGNVTFASVLRNMDADAAAPEAAGPGHWNDPDYLAPGQGMSNAQFRTQMSMWAMLAAPLMVSADLRSISSTSLGMLENREVLAVDQDAAGVQGRLVSASGNGEVWTRPLAGGARAVALLNRGGGTITVETTAAAIGMPPAARYAVRDLWSGRSRTTAGSLAARVPPFAAVLLRVRN